MKKRNIFYTLWDELFYSRYKDTTDIIIQRQIFFINTFGILGFFSVVVFGFLHFLEKEYYIALPELFGGALFLLAIILVRTSRDIFFPKLILLLTQGILLIVLLITGGTANTGIFWYFTYPVTTFFLMGRTNGILLLLSVAILTLFLSILSSWGLIVVAYPFIEVRQMLITFFVISALVYLYQNSIEKAQRSLKYRSDQLEITKRAIEQAKVEDEAILASIGEGMIAVGASGNILIINNAAISILKLEGQNVAGEDISAAIQLKDITGQMISDGERPWKRTIQNGKKVSGEFICVRPDKTEFPIAVIASPVFLRDQIIGVIELFRDITEEKKLDQAKTEFVTLASHQLRTPISAIAWFTEMLLNGDSGVITPEQKEHLTQVYKSNQRMAILVDALLNVSRVDMGNFIIHPEALNLAVVSHDVLQQEIAKQTEEKKIHFVEQYDQNIVQFAADSAILKIVFQNLFANAIKYTPENGTITISTAVLGQVFSENESEREGVLIKVSDTGYGIPQEQRDKIFTKLFRAENVKSKDTDGTGLGLYIVKSVIEQVGGKIWFESKENEGTTFFIWLPKEGMKERQGEKALEPAK